MTSQLLTSAPVRSAEPHPPEPELAQARLALLRELEASLEASQQTLLARDVAGVEQGTAEQARLRRALEILYAQSAPHSRASDPAPSCEPCADSQLAVELRAAERRVLHLGRVQAALLVRAQRSLRMISNLLAGPGERYGPPGNNRLASSRGRVEQEHNPCRA